MLLTIKNLQKQFNQRAILKGIDFHVEKGEVVVVIGPSGSGKTTLLRNLNFLEHADQGTMQFLDQTIDLAKPTKEQQQWVRRHTAMVFQNYNLFKNKTAVQNIAEGLIYGQGIERGIAGIDDSVHSSSPSLPSPLSKASSVNSRSLLCRMALSGRCNV